MHDVRRDMRKVGQILHYLTNEGNTNHADLLKSLVAGIADGKVPWCSPLVQYYVESVCNIVRVGSDYSPYPEDEWVMLIYNLVTLRRSGRSATIPLRDDVTGDDPILAPIKTILDAWGRLPASGVYEECTDAMTSIVERKHNREEVQLAEQVLLYMDDSMGYVVLI